MPVFISPSPLPSFFRKRAEQNFSALLSRAEMDFSTVISALVQSSTALGRPESALGAKNGPVPSGLGRRNTPFGQMRCALVSSIEGKFKHAGFFPTTLYTYFKNLRHLHLLLTFWYRLIMGHC